MSFDLNLKNQMSLKDQREFEWETLINVLSKLNFVFLSYYTWHEFDCTGVQSVRVHVKFKSSTLYSPSPKLQL